MRRLFEMKSERVGANEASGGLPVREEVMEDEENCAGREALAPRSPGRWVGSTVRRNVAHA